MGALRIDTDQVASTGGRVADAATAKLPSADLAAAAADPVSVSVAHAVSNHIALISSQTSSAALRTIKAGARLKANAADYAAQERANVAGVGFGAAPTAVGISSTADGAIPATPPNIPAPQSATTPTTGKQIAQLIHGGPGPAPLHAAAGRLRGHADQLHDTSAALRSSANALDGSWFSAAGDVARSRIGALADWYDRHAQTAAQAADSADAQGNNVSRARSTIPRPAEFDDLERKLDAAVRANAASRGAYSGVVAQLQTQLAALNAKASSGYAQYGAGAAMLDMPLSPIDDAPLTPFDDQQVTDMSSGDIEAIDRANRELLQQMLEEYRQLPDGQVKTDRLADIAAIQNALKTPDSHLIYLARPDDPADMIPAATSIGDPFTADHVSVTVPGVSGTTRGAIEGMTGEAWQLRKEAQDIARQVGGSQNIATVAWVGYQPPPTLTSPETPVDDLAQAGAPKLTTFLENLDTASHNPGHTTALFGHSYGSLTSGIALQNGASEFVDNAVMYGSPGFQASSTADLGMTDDNFFVMAARGDPINGFASFAPLHGWGANPNEIISDPDSAVPRYRFPHLQTDAGWTPIPDYEYKSVATGHSDYGRDAGQRITGYNLATILLDRPDLAVIKKPY